METAINTIKKSLHQYNNRQAILNYYEDEELMERDGIYFQTIEITNHEIKFLSNEIIKAAIDLSQYSTFEVSKDFFKNYFYLKNDTNTLGIYFP